MAAWSSLKRSKQGLYIFKTHPQTEEQGERPGAGRVHRLPGSQESPGDFENSGEIHQHFEQLIMCSLRCSDEYMTMAALLSSAQAFTSH
jgi:hypothetical protein